MFRLIVYLYDLRHDKTPVSIPATLSYFFLLPNVVFPLFPVVDYKMFRRTYYDADHQEIYQRGVEWMFRGVFQLILYRLVYNYASTFHLRRWYGASTLVRYIVSNFATLSARFRTVSLDRRNPAFVRIPPAGDSSPVFSIFQLHRLLAPDKHLLERLHDEAVLLSRLFPAQEMGEHNGPGALNHSRVCLHLAASFLPVVLVARDISADHGHVVLGHAGATGGSEHALRGEARSQASLRKSRLTLGSMGPLPCEPGTFAVISVLWSLWTADSSQNG